MANNEISGPVVNTALIDYVRKIKTKNTHIDLFLFRNNRYYCLYTKKSYKIKKGFTSRICY